MPAQKWSGSSTFLAEPAPFDGKRAVSWCSAAALLSFWTMLAGAIFDSN